MSEAVEYARAVRPFPVARLVKRLSHIHVLVGDLAHETALLVESEREGPTRWRYELGRLMGGLEDLIEAAGEAQSECSRLFDSAPADYERAVSAMLATLRGLEAAARPPGPVEVEGDAAAPLAA